MAEENINCDEEVGLPERRIRWKMYNTPFMVGSSDKWEKKHKLYTATPHKKEVRDLG